MKLILRRSRASFASQRINTLSASTKKPKPHEYKTLGGAPKPVVPVILHGPKGRIPVRGLVDSGADVSTYPVEYAAQLGIDLGECSEQECRTAGGPTTQYTWSNQIEAQVQSMQNMRIRLSATFCKGLDVVLLGRDDFFKAFKVTFDHRTQTFTLEPY